LTDVGAAMERFNKQEKNIAYTQGIETALSQLNKQENIVRNTPLYVTQNGQRVLNKLPNGATPTAENKAAYIKELNKQRKELTPYIMDVRKTVFQ
jgi:hypothetical protein